MEYNFNELKKKCVVSLSDGKKLGKISDLVVSKDGYKVNCFIVSQSGVSMFSCEPIKVNPCQIKTIGEDTILINENCVREKDICEYDE